MIKKIKDMVKPESTVSKAIKIGKATKDLITEKYQVDFQREKLHSELPLKQKEIEIKERQMLINRFSLISYVNNEVSVVFNEISSLVLKKRIFRKNIYVLQLKNNKKLKLNINQGKEIANNIKLFNDKINI